VLTNTNSDLVEKVNSGAISAEDAAVSFNYTWPLVMLACLGVAALLIGLWLKVIDRKKHLGLEEPNIKA
jgi:hypothetical protein